MWRNLSKLAWYKVQLSAINLLRLLGHVCEGSDDYPWRNWCWCWWCSPSSEKHARVSFGRWICTCVLFMRQDGGFLAPICLNYSGTLSRRRTRSRMLSTHCCDIQWYPSQSTSSWWTMAIARLVKLTSPLHHAPLKWFFPNSRQIICFSALHTTKTYEDLLLSVPIRQSKIWLRGVRMLKPI